MVAGRLVDYAIVLDTAPSTESRTALDRLLADEPEPHRDTTALHTRIMSVLRTLQQRVRDDPAQSSGTQPSINHSADQSLRSLLIAVSIETKTAARAEEEAQIQLAIWAAAQLQRLRGLVSSFAPAVAGPLPAGLAAGGDEADALAAAARTQRVRSACSALLGRLTLPLLYVSHSRWTIYYAQPLPREGRGALEDAHLCIFPSREIGKTDSVLDTLRLFKTLRVLKEWVQEDFAAWWDEFLSTLQDEQ